MPQTATPPLPTAAAAASPATRQRRKEARPQELLDAALEVFVEKGFAAARLEDLAGRAGVSKGLLYLYYPSKEELFKALIRDRLSNLIAEGQQVADSFEGSTPELLGCLMDVWWQRFGSTPAAGLHKVIIAEVRNFPELAQFYSDEVITPADRLFSGAVQRGIDRGEFRALPVHDVAHLLIAPLIFMALHQHSFGACPVHGAELDPQAMMRTHLDLLLRGLMAAGEPPSASVSAPISAPVSAPVAVPVSARANS